MPGIDSIIQSINKSARDDALNTSLQGEERVRRLLSDEEKALRARKEQMKRESDNSSELVVSRIKSGSRMDIRKAELQERMDIVSKVFDKAYERLLACTDEEYEALFTRLITDAAMGGESVVASAADTRMSEALIARVNEKLASMGRGSVKLSAERGSFDGGFLLVSEGMQVNCTYEAVRREVREKYLKEVADILFPREGQ